MTTARCGAIKLRYILYPDTWFFCGAIGATFIAGACLDEKSYQEIIVYMLTTRTNTFQLKKFIKKELCNLRKVLRTNQSLCSYTDHLFPKSK